jgi:hypothetical protein
MLPVRLLQPEVVLVDVSGLVLSGLRLRRSGLVLLEATAMKPSGNAAHYRAASDGDDLIGKFTATQRRERVLISNNYSHHVVVFRSTIMLIETDRLKDRMAAWAKTGTAALPIVSGLASALVASRVVTQAFDWIQTADSGLAKVAANVAKSRAIEAKLDELQHLSPDLLDKCFAGNVFEVPRTCITSAVLNRGPLEVVPAAVAKKVVPATTTDLAAQVEHALARAATLAVAAAQVPVSHVPVVPALINVGPLKAELIIKYRDPNRKSELELWLGTGSAETLKDIARMMREILGDDFSERAEMWSALRAALPGKSTRLDVSR